MTIQPGNQTIVLLPEGAVFLPEHERTLVVADLHLGKSAAFRAAGLAVPEGDTERDLERLRLLFEKLEAKRLVVAGDLFHSSGGLSPELEHLIQSFACDIGRTLTLVRGNHDTWIAERHLRPFPITDRLELGDLHIVHDPADAGLSPLHLAGHLHPAVRIPERHRSLRLPCFLLRRNVLVLPAFGGFTGGAVVRPQDGDRFFVPLGSEVVELPDRLLPRTANQRE